MKRYYAGVLCLSFMLMLTLSMLQGCASYDANKAYLAAREHFNAEAYRYLTYFDAATEEDKAVYRKKVDPLFLETGHALDAWGLAIAYKDGDGMEPERYLDAKNRLIDALAELYGD